MNQIKFALLEDNGDLRDPETLELLGKWFKVKGVVYYIDIKDFKKLP